MKIIIYFTALVLLSACYSNSKTDADLRYAIKNIDASEPENVKWSDIVRMTTYVLLENTDASAFEGIDKAKFKNNKIYILDGSGSYYVYVFDINGKFINRIGNRGKGPGEYLRLCDFDVDDKGDIYLYDRQQMQLLSYDSSGKFLKRKKVPFRAEAFNLLHDHNFIFSIAKESENQAINNDKILVTDSAFTIKSRFFKYTKGYLDDKGNTGLFTESPKGLLYNRPVNDSLFVFDRDGKITEAYFVNFGRHAVPELIRDSYSEIINVESKRTLVTSTPCHISLKIT